MDIWLIAVTAATGYLAKQLQNVTLGKDKLLEASCEEIVKQEEASPKCLLSRLVRVNKVTNENKFGVDVPSTSEDNHSETLFDFSEFERRNWKASETVLSRRFIRRKDRYRRVTKPLSSLESCLMSQFHGEQMNMTSPFPSPHSSISRPLLVTDGKRVINKSNADSLWLDQHIRIPELDSSGDRIGKSSTHGKVLAKSSNCDAMLLIKIGISIGIMSSFIASQAEVNRVKQELKQTESLVHDLEDELEMKDSLIVKELDIEKAESISKIEAELEAELERLEINMNTSKIEMESDFEVEFAEGELIDVRGKGKCLDEIESPSGYSTPESGNYAVSPRELSLRLHQVINSRLENRIIELETALQESKKKVKQLVIESSESKKKSSWSWETHEVMMRYKSDSKIADHSEMQPLVMNLTGKALDAFNDSYDELMKINDDYEDDEDDDDSLHQEDFSSTNKSSPLSHHKEVQEQELLDLMGLEDEEGSFELGSEMEKELIKQIVEKTKQGSPVVLNATQKMLFLIEQTET